MSKRIPISSKYLEKPIIQGGMGVGVSLGNLAGAVMKEGGMGVISQWHIRDIAKKISGRTPLPATLKQYMRKQPKPEQSAGAEVFWVSM